MYRKREREFQYPPGKTYEDAIEWMYTGEKKREADSFSIKGVHAGFE